MDRALFFLARTSIVVARGGCQDPESFVVLVSSVSL
jgi:hypothetical protein